MISRCRNCRADFTLLLRKHHCRSCGGIYCDACNPSGPAHITVAVSSPTADCSDPRRSSAGSMTDAMCDGGSPPAVPVAKEEGYWIGKYLGRPNPEKSRSPAQPPKKGSEDASRYCLGCRMGESPCERLKSILKDMYVSGRNYAEPRPPSEQINLSRGSLYGENTKLMVRTDGRDAHERGYIEILNKGDFVFCVKMFTGRSDIFRESSRPSFIPGSRHI